MTRQAVAARATALAALMWVTAALSACAGDPAFGPGPTADWGPFKTVVHEVSAATLAAGRPTETAGLPLQPGPTPRRSPGLASGTPMITVPPAPTPSAETAPTATPTEAPTDACELAFRFLSDVTIPDGTVLAADEPFTKTWAVRNTGTCPWGAHLELRHVDGEPLGDARAAPLPDARPGERTELSLAMRAPLEAGVHRSDWRLCAVGGECFGPSLYTEVVVPAPTAVE